MPRGFQRFRPFAGPEAGWQPADIPDVLVHETVAGWLKNWGRKNPTDLTWGTLPAYQAPFP